MLIIFKKKCLPSTEFVLKNVSIFKSNIKTKCMYTVTFPFHVIF